MFLNPNIFSNLNSNGSNLLDMRNLQEQVTKNCSDLYQLIPSVLWNKIWIIQIIPSNVKILIQLAFQVWLVKNMVKSWYDKTCWASVSGLTVKAAVADSKAFCCLIVPEMEISNNVQCAISGMIKQLKVLKPAAQIENIQIIYSIW